MVTCMCPWTLDPVVYSKHTRIVFLFCFVLFRFVYKPERKEVVVLQSMSGMRLTVRNGRPHRERDQ